uniref:Putative secreted protein n=1 Tax=Amblyomma triste TaxID=251400 RepID=A0A023G1F9_AMBTT
MAAVKVKVLLALIWFSIKASSFSPLSETVTSSKLMAEIIEIIKIFNERKKFLAVLPDSQYVIKMAPANERFQQNINEFFSRHT